MNLLSLERGGTIENTNKRIAITMREIGKGEKRNLDEATVDHGNYIEQSFAKWSTEIAKKEWRY